MAHLFESVESGLKKKVFAFFQLNGYGVIFEKQLAVG
jgi:hypothetical protein